ncbi:MAG: ATP-binding cassette domain-containing protein, partial [Treponema sp.]|nr:ATP-binding cassette domain-containing protein [Treponema sp.]
MLELKNVCMTFHAGTPDENRALKNINLKINQGDFITVIGSNGAGKSTLMNVIAGTYKASSGEIFYEERNVTKEPEYKRARYIGRIFQNPLLGTAGKMSLEDNMVICSKKGSKSLKISLNNKLRAAFREQ